jgi:DNA-binding CsgD family transcriptional regulator
VFCRSPRRGDFDVRETAMLQVLLPHLANAVGLATRLRIAEQKSMRLACVLDRIDSAVILADASARPLFVNERAARLLEACDGLTIEPAGLAAANPAATSRLREAIAAAARTGCGPASPAPVPDIRLSLARPSRRLPLVADVLSLGRLGASVADVRQAGAAVFINEPDAQVAVDAVAVAETFRLTPREAEIAASLAEGQDLARIAAALGLSLGTARNHLKRIFAKTDAHSQAALVARIRGLAAAPR